jgi:hypothetical protein
MRCDPYIKWMPNMPAHERLFEELRKSRRTIADAIEVLRDAGGFSDHDHAEVRIGPLHLSSGDVVSLVDVLFEAPFGEKVCIVSLPTSARFRAIRHGASRSERFEISRLNGAVVDANANVVLRDRTTLRAVEVIPTRILSDPTELDWRIVRSTISMIGAEDRCYRSLRADSPLALPDTVPDLRFLDCSKLCGLELPPLKEIAFQIAEKDKTLRNLSQQKIADALRKFGIRVPKPRPRLNLA